MSDQPKSEDFMIQQRPFPTEPIASASGSSRPTVSKGIFSHYILPAIVFVVIVAVTAWVTQNMPRWRNAETTSNNNKPAKNAPAVLEFTRTMARWDAKELGYVRPTEQGVKSHYDFPFRNLIESDALLGLQRPSCDCVSIEVCLLSKEEWAKIDASLTAEPGMPTTFSKEPDWHDLKPDPEHAKGFKVPKEGQGLIRIHWNSRKGAGQTLNLTPEFWMQPEADKAGRSLIQLKVPTQTAPLYLIDPSDGKVNIGTLDHRNNLGKAEFDLWSITRDDLKLQLEDTEKSPYFDIVTRPLTADDFTSIRARINQPNMRIRSGVHVTVMVHEAKGDKQMDMGPFQIYYDIVVDKIPTDGIRPTIYGRVKGDVEVGSQEDQGRVNLKSFRVVDGTTQTFPIWTELDTTLEPKEQIPPSLDVKVRKDPQQLRSDRTKWLVDLNVPPGAYTGGTIPEASALTLRLIRPQSPDRSVRVPLVGLATND